VTLITPPLAKTGIRPRRFITIEAGTTASIEPTTKAVIGKVARPFDGAIIKPTRPPVENTMITQQE
jgi:hypothetical protein